MDFKAATDKLMELGVPAREIADALGLKPNTVRAMRLDPTSEHRRTAPDGWELAVARLARARADELASLAKGVVTGSAAPQGTGERVSATRTAKGRRATRARP